MPYKILDMDHPNGSLLRDGFLYESDAELVAGSEFAKKNTSIAHYGDEVEHGFLYESDADVANRIQKLVAGSEFAKKKKKNTSIAHYGDESEGGQQ